jgi:MFS family permease
MRTLRAHRAFARFWSAGLCFLLATWALHAVMLIRVFDLTGSPFATGLIPVFASLPGILLGPMAGVIVDRNDRRRVMAICALALAILLTLAVPVSNRGGVGLLFAIIFVEAAVMAFFSPAENALLPALVPDEELASANALNALNDSLGRIAGPAIGAFTLVQFGFAATLIACAILYLMGWGLLLGLHDVPHPVPEGELRPAWATFREGLTIVRSIPVLAIVVAVWALAMVADVPNSAVLPAFMRESVGVSAEFFGNSMSVRGLTGLLGGFLIVALSRKVPPIWLLAGGLLGQGASYFMLGAANDPVWSVLVLFPIGPAAAGIQTGLFTLMQRYSPDAVRGRVFALSNMINGLVVLVVSFTSGSIGEVTGSRAVVIAAGCLHLLPFLVVVFVLRRTMGRIPAGT